MNQVAPSPKVMQVGMEPKKEREQRSNALGQQPSIDLHVKVREADSSFVGSIGGIAMKRQDDLSGSVLLR